MHLMRRKAPGCAIKDSMTAKYPVRQAAAVLLVREAEEGQELFWVRRSREVALGGGFYAFPGGRVDRADEALASRLGIESPLLLAALRETFEETGVLLCTGTWTAQARDEERRALLAEERSFDEVLARLDATPQPRWLLPAGRWLTPPMVPTRFDAFFYVARLPENQTASVWPGELVDGEWLKPSEALDRWRQARALLHPPALHLIRCLDENAFPACTVAMNTVPHVLDHVPRRVEFQAGVHLFPVRTPTIPPATHTNCWVLGDEELLIVDPGSPWEEEQAALAAVIDELLSEGRRVRAIVLTHEHPDHVGGVQALKEHLGNVPVLAHHLTAERLGQDVPVDGFIEDNALFKLDGPLGMRWRAILTSGHARGHLCFFEENTGALVTGDMVAGIGSIVVNPPEGDMADYVASLHKLRALDVRALYPAHGPAIPDGPAKLDEYIAHRAEREALVVAALSHGSGTALELVPRVYTDVPEEMHPLAARSLTAILQKLSKEGRALANADGRWTLAPTG